MKYADKDNPTAFEIFNQMGVDFDVEDFERAVKNLEFKSNDDAFRAACEKYGAQNIINEMQKTKQHRLNIR